MTTQVQMRRAAAATQNARTLASGEPDFDTTNKRFAVHDGSTVGGIPHANCFDTQNNTWGYADASGTNTITITLSKAPAAYVKGQCFTFKAASNITGAATLNVNSLGAKNIYKKDRASGTITAAVSGDIISGGMYTVEYDGTQFQLVGVDSAGLTTVSQGDLNTLTGSVSRLIDSASVTENTILPGGGYGFWPQLKIDRSTGGASQTATLRCTPFKSVTSGPALSDTYTTSVQLEAAVASWSGNYWTAYAIQRYVSSSPPFNMGDGDVNGFLFLLLDAGGTAIASYMADVPPWAYNGPTDIRACRVCPRTGQKFRKAIKAKSLEELLDTKACSPVEYVEEPITQTLKQADMGLIPHPFGDVGNGRSVVLLDPMDERVARLLAYQNAGGDMVKEILTRLRPDNTRLRRKGPKGVMQVGFKL